MYHVLYVDDEKDLLQIAKQFLEDSQEFTIATSTSAQDVLDTENLTEYDAIISDYQMPGMDGISFLKEIRSRFGNIPFILFTGKGREEVVIEAINNGADFYLQKGGDPQSQFAELVHKIKKAVNERQSAETLKSSEQGYRLLLQNANDAVFVHEVFPKGPGKFLEVNDVACTMLGYTREELLMMEISEIDIPEQAERVPFIQDKIFRTGRILFETEHLTRDGRRIPVEVSNRFFEHKGRPAILSIVRDISERKRAEAALRESEARFRQLFERSHAVMLLIEPERGDIRDANPAAAEFYGYSREVLCTMQIEEINQLPGDQVAKFRSQVLPMKQNYFIFPHRLANGTIRTVEVHSSPIEVSEQAYLFSIIHDITKRKQAEEKTAIANLKLALMNDVTYQDIQNKVTALRGYVSIREKILGEEDQTIIGKEKNILESIGNLILKTKEFQRVGEENSKWISLEDEVRIQVDLISGTEKVPVDSDLHGLAIYSDPLIKRVIHNLIENAVTHGKILTHISFHYQETPEGLIVICEDDGVGIPAREKSCIFERVVAGKGKFNLFFAREFLTISGMNITETGKPGKGARFEIRVPKGMYRVSDPAGLGEDSI